MADLKIHIETDGEYQLRGLDRQVSSVQKNAEALTTTMQAINKAAEGKELYFATTKARDGFVALLNEATKLEKAMADPKLQGTDNFKQLATRLTEVREKLTDMASSASMAGRVMSANFAREVSSAANAVKQMEQQMVVAKRNIDKIQSQMSGSSPTVKTSTVKPDVSFRGLSADLGRQKEGLSILETSLQSATGRLNSMKEAQKVFGSATISAANDTDLFLERLNQLPVVGQATTGVFSQMKYALGNVQMALLGGLGFQQLGSRIFQTRSMMQNLEISFETMLQSAEKAGNLMGQLTQTAAKTPFGMMDVTNGAKQLLAYGTAAEDVNGILVKLGDISAGLGLSLGDLVYLYGTTMAQGRMFTQDLRQFMGRGIPMAEEIGKILVAQGKATKGTQAEVQDAVTKGKVNADMVKQAIENMTSAGSRFGGLMERQSSTLEGQWSNIEDTVDMMFNDMGKSTEGAFNKALEIITEILDNWQTIVKVIGSAIVAVGTYKAGLAAASMIERINAKQMEETLAEQEKAQGERLYSSIDERIEALKEREAAANEAVGYDVADKKVNDAQTALGKVVADSSVTDEQFDHLLAEAKASGVINDELERELRLKREILMEQERLTAQAEQEAGMANSGVQDIGTQIENTKKDLDDKNNEIASLDEQLKLAKEEYIKGNLDNYRNAKENAPALQSAYETARDNRIIAEAELGRYNSPEYDNQISSQEFHASIAGARYGEDSAEYQAEMAKVDELKAKREQAKVAFQQACDEEAASLQKVKEAQEALNSTSQVGQKAANVVELDDKISKQQDVVDKAFESGNDETDFEYQAAKQSLEELRQERQLAMEEYQAACEQEIASIQSVIDKENELKAATGGDEDTSEPETGVEESNPAADALEKVKEARENLTDAQEEGGAADEAVANAQEGLASFTEMAGAAEEANTAATEVNTVASEGNAVANETEAVAEESDTMATETNTVADTSNSNAKKVAQLQSAQKTAMQQKETLSTKLNTLQTQADTIAQDQDTAAKGRNSLTSKVLAAGNTALAFGERILTAATNECATAWRGFTAALLANPITTIITAITTLGSTIYMFWEPIKELFGFGADEAEEATQSYTNSAQEAVSKTEQLYAQMEASAIGTKQHKDALDELIKTCEEYGIKLDEAILKGNNEVAKTEELDRVHKALTETLKQEAIQQEYLNQLKAAEENKENADDESKKKYNENRDEDFFSKEEWSGASLQIYDEEIQKAGELKKAMAELQDARVKDAAWVEKYNSLQNEYNETYQKSVDRVRTYVKSIMDGKGRLGEYEEAVASIMPEIKKLFGAEAEHAQALANSAEANENARAASEKAANATGHMTEEQANAAKATRYSKMEVNELTAAAHNLVKSMSGKVIGIDVEFSTWLKNINVPQWMLNKTSKDLSKDLQGWMNILNKMGNKNSINVKGHGMMTKAEVMAKIEQYSQATSQTKATEDRKAEEDAANQKERDKKAKAAAKKAEQERKKREAAAKKEATDQAKRAENTAKANENYSKFLVSSVEKMYEDIQKAETDAMEAGTAKELKQIEDNTRQQLDAIDKQKEKLIDARKKQAEAVWVNAAKGRKASDWKNTAEGKRTDAEWWNEIKGTAAKDDEGNEIKGEGGKTLTLEDLIVQRRAQTEAASQKKIEEIHKKELEAYRDYIDKYGTLQEKKLILDNEYTEKRKEILDSSDTDEQKQWQLRSLDAQHSADTSKMNLDIFKNTIDWDRLFSDMTTLTKAQLEDVKKKLTDLMRSGTLGLEQYKEVLEQIRAIDEEMNAKDTNPWRTAHSQERDRLEQNVTTSQEAYSAAVGEQAFARFAEYAQQAQMAQMLGGMGVNVSQKDITTGNSKDIIGKVSAKYGADSKETKQVQDAFAKLAQSGQKVTESNLKADAAAKNLAQDESKLSKFTRDITEALEGFIDTMDKVAENLNDLPGLLGELGVDEESDTMKGAQDMANAANASVNAAKDFMSGNYVGAAMNGVSAVKSLGSGLNNLLGLGIGKGNAKETNEKIEDLTERNDLLIDAIDRLTEQLNETTGGMKSIKTAQEAIDYQTQKEDNLKEMARLRSIYTAAHHSWAYNWEGFTDEQKSSFSKKIGRDWNGDIWDLSTDEIADLMATPDMVEKIKNTGNGVYANTLIEYLNAWADEAGALDDIKDTLKEKLTQTTFESLRSDFLSTLMDMDADAEDFSEKFTEMLMQSVLNAKMADLLDDDMQAFYDKWSEYAESDGKLTDAEIASLRSDYDALTAKALELRDQAAQITGYEGSDSDADSSTGAWSSLGEETGRALEGRFAAIQIQVTKIADMIGANGNLQQMAAQVAAQTAIITAGNQIADESRTILAQMQLSLASIDNRQDGWDKPMKAMFNQIKDIRDDIRNKL